MEFFQHKNSPQVKLIFFSHEENYLDIATSIFLIHTYTHLQPEQFTCKIEMKCIKSGTHKNNL